MLHYSLSFCRGWLLPLQVQSTPSQFTSLHPFFPSDASDHTCVHRSSILSVCMMMIIMRIPAQVLRRYFRKIQVDVSQCLILPCCIILT
jgi:hypothetical protein